MPPRACSTCGTQLRPQARDADDPFGRPEVVEIELFEDRPVVHRDVVAKERVSVDVRGISETRLLEDERRIEHVEMEREGER